MALVARTAPVRGEVYVVALDPSVGGEIRKARPCVVLSPDVSNKGMPTVIVAPMTTGTYSYPFRVPLRFGGRDGYIVLDQLRVVDRGRLQRRLGKVTAVALQRALEGAREMFAP
jgi:mRNA interferase MazF